MQDKLASHNGRGSVELSRDARVRLGTGRVTAEFAARLAWDLAAAAVEAKAAPSRWLREHRGLEAPCVALEVVP